MADNKIPMNYVSDVLTEAKMFEWAGVGLGQENWYLISSAIKVICVKILATLLANKVKTYSFLGQIPMQKSRYLRNRGKGRPR